MDNKNDNSLFKKKKKKKKIGNSCKLFPLETVCMKMSNLIREANIYKTDLFPLAMLPFPYFRLIVRNMRFCLTVTILVTSQRMRKIFWHFVNQIYEKFDIL